MIGMLRVTSYRTKTEMTTKYLPIGLMTNQFDRNSDTVYRRCPRAIENSAFFHYFWREKSLHVDRTIML